MAKKKSKWTADDGESDETEETKETHRRPNRSLPETQPATLQETQPNVAGTPGETRQIPNRPPLETPLLDITDDLVEDFSRWGMQQDPSSAHPTIRNAIKKQYIRPFEDYARFFKRYLQERGLAK